MVEEIKKLQGINNDEFDNIIAAYVASAVKDLKVIGLDPAKVVESDPLIHTAIISYVLSYIDDLNSEMYANSYAMQKDSLRHSIEYMR